MNIAFKVERLHFWSFSWPGGAYFAPPRGKIWPQGAQNYPLNIHKIILHQYVMFKHEYSFLSGKIPFLVIFMAYFAPPRGKIGPPKGPKLPPQHLESNTTSYYIILIISNYF